MFVGSVPFCYDNAVGFVAVIFALLIHDSSNGNGNSNSNNNVDNNINNNNSDNINHMRADEHTDRLWN